MAIESAVINSRVHGFLKDTLYYVCEAYDISVRAMLNVILEDFFLYNDTIPLPDRSDFDDLKVRAKIADLYKKVARAKLREVTGSLVMRNKEGDGPWKEERFSAEMQDIMKTHKENLKKDGKNAAILHLSHAAIENLKAIRREVDAEIERKLASA
jgi:hypothetical protein